MQPSSFRPQHHLLAWLTVALCAAALCSLSGCGCRHDNAAAPLAASPAPSTSMPLDAPKPEADADSAASPAAAPGPAQPQAEPKPKPQPSPEASPAPVRTPAASEKPDDPRDVFRRRYNLPSKVQILEARQSGDTWTARVQCPGSVLTITQGYQHAYGMRGYTIQTANVNVVRNAGHVTLVMTRDDKTFEMYADQDEQQKDVATLRVRGGEDIAPELEEDEH